ncbi:DUF2505 domain-containing protein [Actinomyces viscosus]|uniref:Protein of uncharacterized function (DUF2505) n=1 Tax=Actinomyces viscosus TaxID=1656 RepID=A0A448PHI2_ACTVI|nr:DUF2505 domain-containing protein [Actinomyces viscosus]TFH53590.1 DUF2505 domain-containing protein [Actinomyces viscosus]VEI14374.1 Protein of uncharacterised function (DUF2505) [Actinomyces viscosus]
MRKTITITYPADPARTARMLADPAYQEERVARAGLDDASVDVAQRGQGFVSTISGSVQPSQLPSVASRFVRSAVSFTVTESWGEPKEDGSRSGGYDVAVKGAPVKVSATSTMAPAADSTEGADASASTRATTVTVDVDLKVTVPLVGKTIEEKAMSMVGRVVADEERRATAWLAEHDDEH